MNNYHLIQICIQYFYSRRNVALINLKLICESVAASCKRADNSDAAARSINIIYFIGMFRQFKILFSNLFSTFVVISSDWAKYGFKHFFGFVSVAISLRG